MGWTTTYKPPNIKATEYLLKHSGELSWPADGPATYTVLDSALVSLKTFYAAVESIDKATGARKVWAAVLLVDYWRSGNENFGWKSMDETMGPYEHNCPERILDLLTETNDLRALAWRARCRATISIRRARPKIKVGMTLKLYGTTYTVSSETPDKRGFFIRDEQQNVYRASHAKLRQATDIKDPT